MLSRFSGRIQPFVYVISSLTVGGILVLLQLLTMNSVIYYIFLYFLVASFIASVLYGIYPVFFKTEKLFRKIGYSKVVIEYQQLKKILYVLIPIMAILVIDAYISVKPLEPLESGEVEKPTMEAIYYELIVWITLGAFLRVVTQIAKEDFGFYFAKGCCKIILEKEDNFEKMKYLLLLLDSYNKYIKRNLKVGINGISKIYFIILNKNTQERNQIINLICESLESDKLNLARNLSSFFKIPDSEFYIQVSFLQNLKQIGVILATAIPIIISVVTVILEVN